MHFNSFTFLVFFAVTFALYCCCGHRWQNRLLLAASYLFYAAWDYRFLALLLTYTVVNYLAGAQIGGSLSQRDRKGWLLVSIVSSLGILGFFKYFGFFVENLNVLCGWIGLGDCGGMLDVILPVGISFYTFQTLSYTIDVYRRKIEPASSFFDFALYVAFFPTILAGPIERAGNLLTQIGGERRITPELFHASVFLILFGLFEKVVVADNLAVIVNGVYGGNGGSGLDVLLATYAYTFQIFADFDGYSNVAKGIGGLMGFQLVTNFNAPYFADNPSDFWRRWHISLSTWLRDYLFIPLGGSRAGAAMTVRNLMLTMLLGGLWHGAGWMFICWGAFHGLLLAAWSLFKEKLSRVPPSLRRLLLFHLICFGWMLFRAESLAHVQALLHNLLFNFDFSLDADRLLLLRKIMFFALIPAVYQYLQFRTARLIPVFEWPPALRAGTYVALFYMIVIFGYNNAQSFIYFQF
jgi:D-alanyl-lipoteichoic acid acyltransferase DltB (MBOAT superfamily)